MVGHEMVLPLGFILELKLAWTPGFKPACVAYPTWEAMVPLKVPLPIVRGREHSLGDGYITICMHAHIRE